MFIYLFLTKINSTNLNQILKASGMFKKATKWAKSEELEGAAVSLMATILAHGPKKTYESEFDVFLQKKIFKKMWNAKTDKRRDEYINSLIVLLRGRHSGYRIGWLPRPIYEKLAGTVLSPYGFVPLAKVLKKMPARMMTVITSLYSKKLPGIKNIEAVELAAEVAVQLAAHSLQLAREQVFSVLMSEKNKEPVFALVALSTLRIIFTSPSRFYEHAGCVSNVCLLLLLFD